VGEDELRAEGAGFLVDAVGQLSADDVDRMLRGVPSTIGAELVRELVGNKLDPRRIRKPGTLLVGPLRKRPPARLIPQVERLSVGILSTFHDALGEERFENPSAADLAEVLDAVLAEHPVAGVRCTLSWVVADTLPAAAAARHVLLTDDRLRLPEWPPITPS